MAIISGVIKSNNLILGKDGKEYIFGGFDIMGHKMAKINDKVRFTPNGFNAIKISIQNQNDDFLQQSKSRVKNEQVELADISENEPFSVKTQNTKKDIRRSEGIFTIKINGALSSLLLLVFTFISYKFFEEITLFVKKIVVRTNFSVAPYTVISLEILAILGLFVFHMLPLLKASSKLSEISKNDYFRKTCTNYNLFLFLIFAFAACSLYFKIFSYESVKFQGILGILLLLVLFYKIKLIVAILKNTKIWIFAIALFLDITSIIEIIACLFVDSISSFLNIAIIEFVVAQILYAVSFFMINDIKNETKNMFLRKQYGFL